MVLYIGRRDSKNVCTVVVRENNQETPLAMGLDKCNRSPCGFSWGYGGSGPAQLAFALLSDCLPDDTDLAYELHQAFKWAVVAKLDKPGWVMDRYDVEAWIFSQLEKWEWVPERNGQKVAAGRSR